MVDPNGARRNSCIPFPGEGNEITNATRKRSVLSGDGLVEAAESGTLMVERGGDLTNGQVIVIELEVHRAAHAHTRPKAQAQPLDTAPRRSKGAANLPNG